MKRLGDIAEKTEQVDRSTVDREMKLLLALARTRQPSEVRQHIHDLAEGVIDWERLYELAWRHRLVPLIFRSLEESGIAIPLDIRDTLDGDRAGAALRSLAYTEELLQIRSAFLTESIEFAVLKGPVLGVAFYDDLGLRPFGDLDILVRFDDVLRAKELLVGLGYRPDPPMSPRQERAFLAGQSAYEFFQDEKGFKVELHTALVHRRFDFHHDIERIWAQTTSTTIGNAPICMLGTDDLLLFLCVHGAKHSWRQLIWVCDVAELIRARPGIEWSKLIDEAEQRHCARMLFLGLYLANRWLDASLPSPVQARLEREDALPLLASHVFERACAKKEIRERIRTDIRFHTLVRETGHGKWRQVVEKTGDRIRGFVQKVHIAVRPSSADRAFVDLPSILSPLYLVVRPIRILRVILFGRRERKRSDS